MAKRPDNTNSQRQPDTTNRLATAAQPVAKRDYLNLAALLGGRESLNRVQKKDSFTKALSNAGEQYEKREFVDAYESLQPVYDKVIADMQRVLARNAEFEANKVAKEQRKTLSAAKEYVQKMKSHAQDVIDHFDRLRQDLLRKPLVRMHLKNSAAAPVAAALPSAEAAPTTLASANETRVETHRAESPLVASGQERYRKAAYSSPQKGAVYLVRDKTATQRVIRVLSVSPDGTLLQIEVLENGRPSSHPIQLSVESLDRQAAKGRCHRLFAVAESPSPEKPPAANGSNVETNPILRLDSQNFGRCCADIVRANIKFSTQLIKDIGDGPFRAGNYEQAFLTFEQIAVGFNAAVANSRRAIADGRRTLTAEKGNLSGKEIQERTAAFVRHEQLIHTAEREFATILEGLRMHLRAQQGSSASATEAS
jgi:hypothetical protein